MFLIAKRETIPLLVLKLRQPSPREQGISSRYSLFIELVAPQPSFGPQQHTTEALACCYHGFPRGTSLKCHP